MSNTLKFTVLFFALALTCVLCFAMFMPFVSARAAEGEPVSFGTYLRSINYDYMSKSYSVPFLSYSTFCVNRYSFDGDFELSDNKLLPLFTFSFTDDPSSLGFPSMPSGRYIVTNLEGAVFNTTGAYPVSKPYFVESSALVANYNSYYGAFLPYIYQHFDSENFIESDSRIEITFTDFSSSAASYLKQYDFIPYGVSALVTDTFYDYDPEYVVFKLPLKMSFIKNTFFTADEFTSNLYTVTFNVNIYVDMYDFPDLQIDISPENYSSFFNWYLCRPSFDDEWNEFVAFDGMDYLVQSYYASTGSFSSGYEIGYDDGYEEGDYMGYKRGEKIGYGDGERDGYDSGYSAGKTDGIKEANNTVTDTSASYKAGHDAGFDLANNTLTTTSTSYTAGYAAGANAAGEYTFNGLMGAVFDAPVNAFQEFFNFEVFGVNLTGLLSALFVLAIVVTILRLVLGG